MNEHEQRSELEEQMLTRARRAMSPTAADAERVLTTVAALVASGAPTATPGSTPAAALGVRTGLLRKLLVGLVIAGMSGSIGYVAGLRNAQSSRPLAPIAVAAPLAEAPKGSNPMREKQAEQPVAPESPAAAATRKRSPVVLRPPAEQAPQAAPEEKPSLAEELAAVKRIERALRNGEPNVALELLDELDQRVPDGVLGEERLAASMMARCAMGLGTRRALRYEFANRYPGSAYLERVARACPVDEPRP
jgi:hypothetical protein